MKLPKIVRLGAFTYAVTADKTAWTETEDMRDGACYGFTSHLHQKIYLNPNASTSMTRVVLLHEILHAAAFAGGHLFDSKVREEEWVRHVAPLLLDAMRRSPGLIEFLQVKDDD